MNKQEVIDYFDNINKPNVVYQFAKRYVEEHTDKDWNEHFFKFLNSDHILHCFNELFHELEINVVEEISTKKILKLI